VSERPSFAVVIPAFNEAAGIRACVTAVDAALAELPNETALIVVDDGSRDGTADELAALAREHPRLVVETHPANRGYGAGLRTGTLAAAGRGLDYVVFMDSDLTNDPRYLRDFAARMADGVDVIKASRYVPGGGASGVPAWRRGLSVLGNKVARLLFRLPVSDCTNGFRAVRTRLLTAVELEENGFAVIMEELYRLRPLATSYADVPIVLTGRTAEQGASSFSFGPRAMARYLKYPLLSALGRGRA
jgi:glycosyltransferase involved in cell wall biosynthesis